MPFEEISYYELSSGDVYKIYPYPSSSYKDIQMKGVFIRRNVNVNLCNFSIKNRVFVFTNSVKFYKFVSVKEKIQKQMEERCLDIVLKKITGDPNFEW